MVAFLIALTVVAVAGAWSVLHYRQGEASVMRWVLALLLVVAVTITVDRLLDGCALAVFSAQPCG